MANSLELEVAQSSLVHLSTCSVGEDLRRTAGPEPVRLHVNFPMTVVLPVLAPTAEIVGAAVVLAMKTAGFVASPADPNFADSATRSSLDLPKRLRHREPTAN